MRPTRVLPSLLLLLVFASPSRAQFTSGGTLMSFDAPGAVAFAPDGAGGIRQFQVDYQGEIRASAITGAGLVEWATQPYPGYWAWWPNAMTAIGNGARTSLCADADGTGGAVFAWADSRTGTPGIYVQRASAAGVPLWTANGLTVLLTNKYGPDLAVCGDGSGGAFVAYHTKTGLTNNYPVRVRHVSAAGSLDWAAAVSPTNLANANATEIKLAADGLGGVIVCWRELSLDAPNGQLLAQRLDPNGALLWGASGIGVATQAGIEHNARMQRDGGGGAYFVWEDARLGYGAVFGEQISAAGAWRWAPPGQGVQVSAGEAYRPSLAVDPVSGDLLVAYVKPGAFGSPWFPGFRRFASTGTPVFPETYLGISYSDSIEVAADGIGGAVMTNADTYLGGVTVIRVAPDNSIPLWERVGYLPADQPYIVGDGRGGGVVAWRGDGWAALGTSAAIRAQKMDVYGVHGEMLPVITSVTDVPNDEGGYVRVRIVAAGADPVAPVDTTLVYSYGLWRRLEQASLSPSEALAPAGAADPRVLLQRMREGPVRVGAAAATAIGLPAGSWESIGLYPAAGLPSYTLVAPTRRDSSASGRHREVFVVSAHSTPGAKVGVSPADSASSVDNLAPPPPANLAGGYLSGTVNLTWSASPAADLAGYSIYRGPTAGFVPGSGNRLGTSGTTGFTDPAFVPGQYYKVTAVDRHDNESAAASLAPGQVTGVAAGAPAFDFLAPPGPNPSRAGAGVSFGLARAGQVELRLFDLGGRVVRVLASGPFGAGPHALAWDGRDAHRRELPAGLYWLRLESPGFTATRKLVRGE